MLVEMGNYVDDKPSIMETCFTVESLESKKNAEEESSEKMEDGDMEMNKGEEIVVEGNCDKEGNGNGKEITSNDAVEESREGDLSQDGECEEVGHISEVCYLEQGDTNKSNKENIEESCKGTKVSSKSSSVKKSKKQRKEERMKIHSETHRLMREREISIPYHVPKQRTLREFLSRKKNRANIPLNTPSSKMLEIWKDIEESTRNAFEFFKSDSESDVESCNNNEKHGEKGKKNKEEDGESRSLHNSENSHSNNLGNTADDENVTPDLTNGNAKAEDTSKEENAVEKNNDNNAMFICENAITGPDDLDNGNDNFLTSGHQVEESTGDGIVALVNNEGSSNVIIGLNEVQSENTEINESTEEQDEKIARERTCEWVKNIPALEMMLKPKKKEILLQKLNPKLLTITPKLSGEPDSIIDLENDKNSIEIGAKNLKKRFLENCFAPRNKPKSKVELTITTSEKNESGEIRNVATEKLIYTSDEVLKDPDLDKPGAKLQRLREELKKKIEAKWEEENKKKMEEMVEEKNTKVCDDVVEEEEELIDDDEMEETDDDSGESEPEEDDVLLTDKKMKKNRYIDSEAEESDCDEDEGEGSESGNEGADESDDDKDKEDRDEDSCDAPQDQHSSLNKDEFPGNEYSDSQSSLIPPYQPGGGMLHGGSELTQNDGDISLPKNVLSPALRLSLDFPPSNKNDSSQQPWDIDFESPEESNTSNFVPCFPENKNFDLNDAYEFCSGKFPGEGGESRDFQYDEKNSQEFINTVDNESQLNSNDFGSPKVKNNLETVEDDEDKEEKKKKRSRLIILSDDSDEETEKPLDDLKELENITERVSPEDSDDSSENSLPVKNRGKRKNLVFSDEEDDSETERKPMNENDESEEEISSQNGEEDPFADEEGREALYDSEENEIVNPGEYFDKEAELSGSEWSGDEDERGLDEFEVEDGDDEKLDEKKLRSQLEKIHMRTLLDDDAREVRLLQELLFEDGDLFDDGPKREKNFRWKDLGTFFDDDDENDGNDAGKSQEDMEEDEQSRQSRHEKELFLLQMKSKREEMGVDDDDECGISFLKRGRVVIESSSRTALANKKVSRTVRTEVDEFSFKTPFALTNKRGSFLSRNEEFLSRLAKFTANQTDNILGPKHSKNFVFAAKSPEKDCLSSKENSHPKRKNVSPKGDHARNKKAKLDKPETSTKTSILDRLA